jgi:tetratricopeptide (TPR) repeat protein
MREATSIPLPNPEGVSVQPAPQGSRWLIPLQLLRAGTRAIREHPLRSLIVVTLAGVALVGFALGAVNLWGYYHLRKARIATEHYHTQEAIDQLQYCLRLWPHDRESLLLAARAARRTESFDEAEQMLSRYPNSLQDKDYALERMLLRIETGDVDELSRTCQKRIEENDPASGLILEAMINAYIRLFRSRQAEACLRIWMSREPENPRAFFLQGVLAEQMEARQEATLSFMRVLELDPGYDEARLRLAMHLLDVAGTAEALPHLEYLQRKSPNHAMVQVYLARCRNQMGENEEAKRILDNLLSRRPDFAPALAQRGKVLVDLGNLEEAEQDLRRALDLEPGDPQLIYQLSQCLLRNGKTEESRRVQEQFKAVEEDIQHIREIVGGKMQKNPRDPQLHYEAGMIALRAGSTKNALRWFDSALKIDPNHAPTHRALSEYYQRLGQLGLSQEHWEKAKKADPVHIGKPPEETAKH